MTQTLQLAHIVALMTIVTLDTDRKVAKHPPGEVIAIHEQEAARLVKLGAARYADTPLADADVGEDDGPDDEGAGAPEPNAPAGEPAKATAPQKPRRGAKKTANPSIVG